MSSGDRQPAGRRDDFHVRFWGVRGSVPCAGPEFVRYGGNTSCLEVRCGPHLLILDGGTGLRALGGALKAEEPIDADLFLTHSHIDHINGIPFVGALFNPANRIRMWAGHLKPEHSLKEVICTMMVAPIFPVPIMPTVLPNRSNPISPFRLKFRSRTRLYARWMLRFRESIRPTVCSATA